MYIGRSDMPACLPVHGHTDDVTVRIASIARVDDTALRSHRIARANERTNER